MPGLQENGVSIRPTIRAIPLFCGLILFMLSGVSFAVDEGFAGVILSEDAKERKDTGTFDCASRVHVVVEGVSGPGRHVLEADWIGPDGKRLKHSRQEFKVKKRPVDAWVWLEPAPDLRGKTLFASSPSRAFKGLTGWWTVKVYLDDAQIGDKGFIVVCQRQ